MASSSSSSPSSSSFLALLFRMKYINRWGLMKNSRSENLTEHSAETALIAHYLAVCGNRYGKKSYNPERLALLALYHDATEIITGDLPTPIKYYSREMRETYRAVEENAQKELLARLPDELRDEYAPYIGEDCTPEEQKLLKAADKLSALIKCVEEEKNGNAEFSRARESTLAAIRALQCDEAERFLWEALPAFSLTLDEL